MMNAFMLLWALCGALSWLLFLQDILLLRPSPWELVMWVMVLPFCVVLGPIMLGIVILSYLGAWASDRSRRRSR